MGNVSTGEQEVIAKKSGNMKVQIAKSWYLEWVMYG